MRELLSEGIDLRGYFHWTLADNFEWNEGWHLRFGLYELDPATQVRRPRPSAQVYERVIRESRLQRAEDESWPAGTVAVNGNGAHSGGKDISGELSDGIVNEIRLGK
jgi:beta-glucosidase